MITKIIGFGDAVIKLKIPPLVTAYNKNNIYRGEELILTGRSFVPNVNDNKVYIGGVQAIITSATYEEIKCIVPMGTAVGLVNVVVENIGGSGTVPFQLNVLAQRIDTYTILNGYSLLFRDHSFTINGIGFSNIISENIVRVNGVQCIVTGSTLNTITAKVPHLSAYGTLDYSVEINGVVVTKSSIVITQRTAIYDNVGYIYEDGFVVFSGNGGFAHDNSNIVRFGVTQASLVYQTKDYVIAQVPNSVLVAGQVYTPSLEVYGEILQPTGEYRYINFPAYGTGILGNLIIDTTVNLPLDTILNYKNVLITPNGKLSCNTTGNVMFIKCTGQFLNYGEIDLAGKMLYGGRTTSTTLEGITYQARCGKGGDGAGNPAGWGIGSLSGFGGGGRGGGRDNIGYGGYGGNGGDGEAPIGGYGGGRGPGQTSGTCSGSQCYNCVDCAPPYNGGNGQYGGGGGGYGQGSTCLNQYCFMTAYAPGGNGGGTYGASGGSGEGGWVTLCVQQWGSQAPGCGGGCGGRAGIPSPHLTIKAGSVILKNNIKMYGTDGTAGGDGVDNVLWSEDGCSSINTTGFSYGGGGGGGGFGGDLKVFYKQQYVNLATINQDKGFGAIGGIQGASGGLLKNEGSYCGRSYRCNENWASGYWTSCSSYTLSVYCANAGYYYEPNRGLLSYSEYPFTGINGYSYPRNRAGSGLNGTNGSITATQE